MPYESRKGHLTETQVAAGTHSRENKIGIDLADVLADIGAEGFDKMIQRIAAHWAQRRAA